MSAVRGKDVIIYVFSQEYGDYIPYRCAEDITIRFTNEIIDVTTVGSGKFFSRRPRRIGWSVSLSGVSVISGDAIESERTPFFAFGPDNIQEEQELRIEFTDPDGLDEVFEGTGYIESGELTAPQEDFSSYSLEIIGSGGYTLAPAGTIVGSGGVGTGIIGSTFIVGG